MGIAKKTDGRYVVGVGVENANDYKGSASYRDIYIQLTESGATEKSEEYLEFLKDYAVHANALGNPIMPPGVNVWISNNGVTTAVEADDVSIDGENYTICGIKWNGSAWNYSDAGKVGGIPPFTASDIGKVLMVVDYGDGEERVIVPQQTGEFVSSYGIGYGFEIVNANLSFFASANEGDTCSAVIDGNEYTLTYAEIQSGIYGFVYSQNYALIPVFVDDTVDGVMFVSATASLGDTATISASISVPSVEPKWENVGVVANLTFQNTSGGVIVNHYTSSKTYAEILALVTAGVPVTVRYCALDDSGAELPLTVEYVPFSAVSPGRYVEFSKCAPGLIDDTSVTINYRTIHYLAQAVPEVAPEAIYVQSFEVTSTID